MPLSFGGGASSAYAASGMLRRWLAEPLLEQGRPALCNSLLAFNIDRPWAGCAVRAHTHVLHPCMAAARRLAGLGGCVD